MCSGVVNVIPIQFDENKNPYFYKINPEERSFYGGTPIGKLNIRGKSVCVYRHTLITATGREKQDKRFIIGIATKHVPVLMIQEANLKALDKEEVSKMIEQLKHYHL